ncbi:MAG: hypothetical protein QOF89_4170 [Acidobacteriota bacterium]|nr:hypothetical protein [Acidobacteriota bacterium]
MPPPLFSRPGPLLRRSVPGAILVAFLAVGLGGATNAPPDSPPLRDGQTLEPEIGRGETQTYSIELQAGQFVRVTVQENGIDLTVRLVDSQGTPVSVADSYALTLNPRLETEDLAAVAERSGPHRLQVVASRSQNGGRYLLHVEGPRMPEPADRIRTEAVKATWLGMIEPAGSPEDQIRSLDRAVALWEEVGAHRKVAQILYFLGEQRQKLLRYAEAAKDFQRSAAVWAGETGPQRQVWELMSLNATGLNLVYANRADEARTFYEKALSLARETANEKMQGLTLGNLGALVTDQGDVRRGIELKLQGLALTRKAGDGKTEAKTLGNLAFDYQLIAENQKAAQYQEEALARARQLGDRGQEGLVLNNLAALYSELGDYDKALSHWQEALTLARAIPDRVREAVTLNNLGTACQRLGRYAAARRYFEQALPLAREVGSSEAEIMTLDNQAFLALRVHRPAQALELAKQALPLTQGSQEREAFSRYALGSAYRDLASWNEARRELAAAQEIYRQRGQVLQEADVTLALARVERSSGNLEAALARARFAIDLVESARSRVTSQDLRASFSAARQDFYEVLIDILMALHARNPNGGFAAEALRASERARARILLEVLDESGTDIRQGADPALVARERSLRDDINTREWRRIELARQGNPDPVQLAEARRRIAEVLEDLEQVEASLRESSPRYAALTQPQPLAAADIQGQVLDGQALLLEYALGARSSFLWLVGPGRIETFKLPGRGRIESVASQYYKHLTVRNAQRPGEDYGAWKTRIIASDHQAERLGRELSRMILAPVEKRLGAQPLLVVTEGALQYIPFSALPLLSSGTPLGTRHEVVSLPSATALAALRRELRERKPAPREMAIFADPVFQKGDKRLQIPVGSLGSFHQPIAPAPPRLRGTPGLASGRESGIDVSNLRRLPFSHKEAETLASLVPLGQIFRAEGFAASKAAVTSGGLAAYRKLHFATHGVLDSFHPELSGLVLSLYDEQGQPQDGVLRLNDIYNLHLDADLVVLSACRTALGKEVRGEGLIGLTRGFMYAGAARVLASLWSVEDQATAELMGSFYRGMLREGLSPAAALRKAQLEMARDPKRKSPYYWAGFSLQGEWR